MRTLSIVAAGFLVAACTTQPRASLVPERLSPEAAARLRAESTKVLFWSQEERDQNFRAMEKLFPSRRVEAARRVRLLPTGAPLAPALGGETAVSSAMATMNIAGLLVLQGGKVRLERYSRGFGPGQRWTSFSVAKSLTSTLVGAAVQDGHIKSIDDSVTRYIPELQGSAYDGVTVRQVLTMTSGVRWNEDYTDPESDVARMLASPTPPGENTTVAYLKGLSREAAPGTKWVYKTGETNLIGVLVRRATGRTLASYLSEKIWRPYGMEADAFWQFDESGQEIGGCCISATLRDYGRIGQFVLDGGVANGKRVVPEWWFREATRTQAETGTPGRGYGFQWWTGPDGTFNAVGIFGQLIHVNPQRRLVVVMSSAWPKATGAELGTARASLVTSITAATAH